MEGREPQDRVLGEDEQVKRAALLLLLGALTIGCSSGSGSTPQDTASSPDQTTEGSSSPSPTPLPTPVVGDCHRLSFADAAEPEDTTSPVPCRRGHTSETVKVGQLPALTGGDTDVESPSVRERVAKACSSRLLRYAGGDSLAQRLSRLEVVWFTPSKEAADGGATWFRCDVVGLAAANQLIRLPRTLKGALDQPDASDRFGTCGTKQPGKPGFARVVCRRHHAWRAVDTVDLDRNARYLGKNAAAQGDAECKDVASARANGALKYTWSFEWPTRDQWRAGQRYGYCWVPG